MTILGIVGRCITPTGLACQANAGKDTVADMMKGYSKIALADPMKRILQSIWQFSYDQLWGPSSLRNVPDPRYPLPNGGFLTPRKALQALDSMGQLESDCWNRLAYQTARLLEEGEGSYTPDGGFQPRGICEPRFSPRGVVITDVRFQREVDYLQKNNVDLILVERKVPRLPEGLNTSHPSEVGLLTMPHNQFAAVIKNTTLESLPRKVESVLRAIDRKRK